MKALASLISMTLLVANLFGQKVSVNKTDSLFKETKVYITEDPVKSQQLLKEAIHFSKVSRNNDQLVKSYLAIAESLINFNSFEEANRYIDSAIVTAKRNRLYKEQIHCIVSSSKIEIKKNDKNAFLKKAYEALSLAKKYNFSDEEVNVNLLIGDFQKTYGDYETSLKHKNKALEIASRLNNKQLIADSWNSIGSTYWYFSHFQEALEHYYKAYIIRQEIKDTLGTIASLKNLGLTYRDLSIFDKALSQLNQALKLSEEINNKYEMADILNLLGSLHYRFNRYNEAILYYKQSLDIRNKYGFLCSTASTLENLARAYTQKSLFNEAYENLEDALKIREQLLDQSAIASTQNEIGNLFNQKGNIAEALRRYLISLKIREKIGSDPDIAKSFTNIGLTYRKLGLLKNATTYLEQARDLILKGEDPSEGAYVLINLGNLYVDQKRYGDANKVFQEALAMREKTGDKASIAKTYRSIAQVQMQIGQTGKAKDNFLSALKISQKLNDDKTIADTYNDLGNLERQIGNLPQAIKDYEVAIKIYDEAANFEGKALCLRKIGELQIKQGQLEIAEKNIDQSISIGKEINNMVLVYYGYLAKHDFYKAKKNYQLALDFYDKHIRLRDSLEAQRKNEKNLEAQLDLELDKKKEEIKSMEEEVLLLRQDSLLKELEIEKQKKTKYLFIAFSSFILIFGGIAYWGYYQKRKRNQVLKEKLLIIQDINEKLSESEKSLKLNIQTKDKLFSIIAHDLKSPFNALVGLTEILSQRANDLSPKEISEFSNHINKSSNTVLKLIDNLLNWSRSQTGKIEIKPEIINLKEIVDSCIEVLSMSANEKNIELKPRLNANDSAFADKETITTVIRNLLSNAIKFTSNNGEVVVWANKVNGCTEIYITDNGVGISKEKLPLLFRIDKNNSTKGTNQETGTGLGLIICKEFIEKNNGSISVESEPNVGTTFIIKLPNQKV